MQNSWTLIALAGRDKVFPISSHVVVSSFSFTGCTANLRGGAIASTATALTPHHSTFSFNTGSQSCGAVAVAHQSQVTIDSSRFVGNKALKLFGRGMLVSSSASSSSSSSSSSAVTLASTLFTDNLVPSGGGGGLLWDGDDPVVRMVCPPGSIVQNGVCVVCLPDTHQSTLKDYAFVRWESSVHRQALHLARHV